MSWRPWYLRPRHRCVELRTDDPAQRAQLHLADAEVRHVGNPSEALCHVICRYGLFIKYVHY